MMAQCLTLVHLHNSQFSYPFQSTCQTTSDQSTKPSQPGLSFHVQRQNNPVVIYDALCINASEQYVSKPIIYTIFKGTLSKLQYITLILLL